MIISKINQGKFIINSKYIMEKEPTFGNKENSEEQLVRLLKEKGVENPEVRNSLVSWTLEQEKRVEQSDDYRLEQIKLNLLRADVYRKAGYMKEALENLQDALTQAWNEHREKLYQTITKEIDELENSIEKQKISL